MQTKKMETLNVLSEIFYIMAIIQLVLAVLFFIGVIVINIKMDNIKKETTELIIKTTKL